MTHSPLLSDFDFEFPPHLIAMRTPGKGKTRILNVPLSGAEFSEMPAVALVDAFRPGDCLVVNNTKVIPARLLGHKKTGGQVEALLIRPEPCNDGVCWQAMVKPGRSFLPEAELRFGNATCRVLSIQPNGERLLHFDIPPEEFHKWLERVGHIPLPPYIQRPDDASDKDDYQTVFAKVEGAVAAPTASLHFSEVMMQAIRNKGVHVAEVTLHVGPGTFQNIQVNDYTQHQMHGEFYQIDQDQADIINRSRAQGGRVICVGTTSTRVLETVAQKNGLVVPGSGVTHAFIYPGYQFKVVQGLVTNFHWPKSSLILLVSALAGRERTLAAYNYAVSQNFKLFSYGDGMLIL